MVKNNTVFWEVRSCSLIETYVYSSGTVENLYHYRNENCISHLDMFKITDNQSYAMHAQGDVFNFLSCQLEFTAI
jgi:hypothetical protein